MSEEKSRPDQRPEVAREILQDALAPQQIARRGFMLASLGFLVSCASGGSGGGSGRDATLGSSTASSSQQMPHGLWTTDGQLPPQKWAQPVSPDPRETAPPAVRDAIARKPAVVTADDKPAAAGGAIANGYDGKVIPRSAWTRWCPNPREMDPLGTVRKITVHHTGNPYAFTDTSVADVKEELVHVMRGELGEGHTDIAYHYVIDPAGRVWAARDIRFEGRHVRDWKGVDNRSGNVGVMLLGNFERQKPTNAQLASLEKFVIKLQKQYKVPRQKLVGGRRSKEVGVFTHLQLSPTECPGDYLQSPWERDIFGRLMKTV